MCLQFLQVLFFLKKRNLSILLYQIFIRTIQQGLQKHYIVKAHLNFTLFKFLHRPLSSFVPLCLNLFLLLFLQKAVSTTSITRCTARNVFICFSDVSEGIWKNGALSGEIQRWWFLMNCYLQTVTPVPTLHQHFPREPVTFQFMDSLKKAVKENEKETKF